MKFSPLEIPEVVRIEPQVFGDERGHFFETWHARKFADAGIDVNFVQDNHSYSEHGVLRGLHYQVEQPQGKLVRVVSGEIFDVAVDLRRSSATFGRWVGEVLSAANRRMLWIPPGFAHGFYVISTHAEFLYKCSNFYAPQHERTIRWDDPDLAVSWPVGQGERPTVSEKDAAGNGFRNAEVYS